MKNSLLARFAENIFWLARFMERAENLARILEVTETHARDEQGFKDWAAILEMNADMERFRKSHAAVTVGSAARFYVLERDNPTSILAAVSMARENARSLRHLISTEMWTQINMFHARLKELTARDIAPTKLAALCGTIKRECQAHTGITNGTLYRDEGWSFYWLGKAIERADQASRLIDIGYRRAVLSGNPLDSRMLDSHWHTMLRSASGYQAFCRTHQRGMNAEVVVEFLLFDRQFPRSIASCLDEALEEMARLRDLHGVDVAAAGMGVLEALRDRIHVSTMADVSVVGLHGFIDAVQRDLFALTDEMRSTVFGHGF